MRMRKTGKSVYEEITQKVVAALKQGVLPWLKPWDCISYGMHRNGVTGRHYRGVNVILLNLKAMEKGFIDPRWVTYRNAVNLGGSVRRGEKGIGIIFWTYRSSDSRSEISEPDQLVQTSRPFARVYAVFNVEQCEGLNLEPLEQKLDSVEQPNELAEQFLRLPTIYHGGDKAYYNCLTDVICLPHRESFTNPNHYYSTTFHELTHWTGHPLRLNRNFNNKFGDQAYAFEELVAEMGSAFLGAIACVPFEGMGHSEYIDSWLEIFNRNNRFVMMAAAKAQASVDFVLMLKGELETLKNNANIAS